MRFDVEDHAEARDVADQLARDLETLLAVPDRPLVPDEVSFTIVRDAEMLALHERFTGDASTTDVMSFETAHDTTGRVIEGDVVVCLDVATRESVARTTSVRQELLLYALHGLLHLSGFDDLKPDDHARMHEAEDAWLESAGFGRVFRP
ncbi:MAG: rRNA maturation RNase YbeY [Planctomycetota bacterium]